MASDLIAIVFALSDAIPDTRTQRDIYLHGLGEMGELSDEIELQRQGAPAGPDGVVGEAVDVILCMLDIIRRHDPQITKEEIEDIARVKGQKWLDGVRAKLARVEAVLAAYPAS